MTGRANHRKGFGWVVPHIKAIIGQPWSRDSQIETHARAGRKAKRRDNRRGRAKVRNEIRKDHHDTESG